MKIIFILFIILSLFENRFVNGQNAWSKSKLKFPSPVCYASDKVEKSFIPPPKEFLLKSGEKKSDIIVTYSLFPPDGKAKAAFEYAVDIWEHIIESDIPIHIEARWRTMDSNILGSSGPTDYLTNFEYAPRKNRLYPISVVEKITKSQINGSTSPDIEATFNKEIKWYFGTDGNTPDLLYDFVTVVLHEIGHGLGFTGFFFVTGRTGGYGNENAGEASAFDILVMNDKNELLTDTLIFKMPSSNLYNAFTSELLFANSPTAITNNSGKLPKLYAPSTWNDGSSIHHLNDATYPFGNENSLMTHAVGKGEAVHDPGSITKGILADIGWKHMKLNLEKPKDIEVRKPIVFNLSIESDFEIDSTDVFVVYSTNSLKNLDSLLLIPNKTTGIFTATLNPKIEAGKIDYYINAGDKMNRTFKLPTEAPVEFYSVVIGPDNIPPQISHSPIPYFVSNGEKMKISTQADDNLGVDSVYVEFQINNITQPPFGLKLDSATTYSAFFNTDTELLNDGDIIKYQIFAIDSSKAKNRSKSPVKDFYSFKVEKIFNPIGGYFSDFNNPTKDFIISDFDIYTEKGFENGSLHSPHPYPSPNDNNKHFDFTTLLKYPIILKGNGTMSFDEVVLVEPGEVLSKFGDDDFYDYVVVEGSKDNGKTWHPIANGYDSGDKPIWKTNYNKDIDYNQVSKAVGIPAWYINREIKLLENGKFKANDTILIQFRLYSDPYAHGWGWTIDNLRIQTPVSTPSVILSPGNILVYPNPFNDILNITVQAKNNIEELTIEIINIYGQKISSIQNKNVFGEIKLETDLSHLTSGMYLMVVKENGKPVYSKKIIRN